MALIATCFGGMVAVYMLPKHVGIKRDPPKTLCHILNLCITVVSFWLTIQRVLFLLVKLIIAQPVANFPAFYDTSEFIVVFATVRHWFLCSAR
jgi:hypothetical protein